MTTNSKEIHKHFCRGCDSEYKITFHDMNVSGQPRFCPFCGDETYSDDAIDEFEANGFHDLEDE